MKSPHMADCAEPEIPQGPADSLKAAWPPATEALPNPEISAPMLDVHAPHETVHTWKDFLVHIVAITIGLLIAVGLEQTVEFFHHRHQRLQLEEQIREVLSDDTELVAADTAKLAGLRAYLVNLQSAVVARQHGQAAALPAVDDPRAAITLGLPSLAPYEAAKDNGT